MRGFNRVDIRGISNEQWADVQSTNTALETLRAGCKAEIVVDGDLARSKLAWMCACLEQGFRYRLVALADGLVNTWQAGNPLCASIIGRSLLETVALIVVTKDKIADEISGKNIKALYEILYGTTFATRNAEIVEESKIFLSTNVLTLIKKLDKILPGIFEYYENVSERVHPNHGGHRGFFGRLDHTTRATTFSFDSRLDDGFFISIQVAYGSIELAQRRLDAMQNMIPEIANLQEQPISAFE